ncbi:MAG: hypothetical protein AB8H12_23780 [Lewinella sp.]
MHLRFFLIIFLSGLSFSLSATSIFDQLQEAAGEEPLAINLTVALDSLVSPGSHPCPDYFQRPSVIAKAPAHQVRRLLL